MRKDEIYSSHMDVYLIPEEVLVTCTTLDMPSWTSFDYFFLSVKCYSDAPFIFSIAYSIVSLPECKVCNLFLVVFVVFDTDTRYHPVKVQIGKFSIVFELAYTIIDTPIFGEISISLLYEPVDNLTHIIDEFCNRHDVVCRDDSESSTVIQKSLSIDISEFFSCNSLLSTVTDNLVLHIGYVHCGSYLVSEVA
jgi:hypothetical protein